ncbi:MAG: hypothetical protein QOF13_2360 [Solirubrobacterales bacterium]|jgi:hypothetical protein|nr:hypothetical protein [Solirubrobacterales bacterium]
MRNLKLTQDPQRSRLGVFAGGALLLGCCVVGPLLIGAACVLSIGMVGELAVVGALLAIVAFALWRGRVSRNCC